MIARMVGSIPSPVKTGQRPLRRIKNAKFKMSKLPDAASILAFLIFNLLILNWLRCLGFGAWTLELELYCCVRHGLQKLQLVHTDPRERVFSGNRVSLDHSDQLDFIEWIGLSTVCSPVHFRLITCA
jgi:hypothetical protein